MRRGSEAMPRTVLAVLEHMQSVKCRWQRWMPPRSEFEKWDREYKMSFRVSSTLYTVVCWNDCNLLQVFEWPFNWALTHWDSSRPQTASVTLWAESIHPLHTEKLCSLLNFKHFRQRDMLAALPMPSYFSSSIPVQTPMKKFFFFFFLARVSLNIQ